jgi:divalent metal cation (Fe/Co/Zn/Cd) transporter
MTEVYIRIDPTISVLEAHNILEEIEHEVMDHIKYISNVIVDIEPEPTL